VDKLRPLRDRIKGKVVITNRPGASIKDEENAGANAVLYYGFSLWAAYYGVKAALSRLKETGDANGITDILANVEEFERFIGYPGFVEKAKRYGLTK
jgi:2-methylisocitrate lyase-like PEP mutase family enzyme